MWCVYDSCSIVTDVYIPVACFDSFWDASDYVGDHADEHLFLQEGEPFVPVITKADIDAYMACDAKPTSYGNPLDGFSEYQLPKVLMFLGWVAEFKAMQAPQSDPGHFGYEHMLYQYHQVAEAIS
jgi:hypothetical protein